MKEQNKQLITNENNKRELNDEDIFLTNNSWDGGFLQSSLWEKFQKALGKETVLIDKREKGFWGLMIRYSLSLVRGYWFFPRGPVFSRENRKEAVEEFSKLVKKIKQESCLSWIRIEPQTQEDLAEIKKALNGLNGLKLVKSPKNHEPAQTLFLDLDKSKEKILLKMKPKTRYNIRLAKKRGIKIRKSREKKDIEKFYDLIEQTSRRNQIISFSFEHYEKMLKIISKEYLELFLAEFEGVIIGGILVSFFGKVAIYLHGATSDLHRNVMAMYLLQWEAIKEAQKRKCKKYDFNGINPEKTTSFNYKKTWEGITRFKKGFNPTQKTFYFPGCWDIVLDTKRYWVYKKIQFLKNSWVKIKKL